MIEASKRMQIVSTTKRVFAIHEARDGKPLCGLNDPGPWNELDAGEVTCGSCQRRRERKARA